DSLADEIERLTREVVLLREDRTRVLDKAAGLHLERDRLRAELHDFRKHLPFDTLENIKLINRLRAALNQIATMSVNGMQHSTEASVWRAEIAREALAGCTGIAMQSSDERMAIAMQQDEKPEPQQKCTCTPPSSGGSGNVGWATSGAIDPNCPLHWRSAM